MLVSGEKFQPQDFESRGRLLQHSVVLDLLSTDDIDRAPTGEVNGQYRSYSILCAAMQADDGELLVVRKDPFVDSRSSSDWLVAKVGYDEASGQPIFHQENVLAANIDSSGVDGDHVELMISQNEHQHRGPNVVSFNVDKMYRPVDDKPVEVGYLNRYGERVRPSGLMTKSLKTYQTPVEAVSYSNYQSNLEQRLTRLDILSQRVGQLTLKQAA